MRHLLRSPRSLHARIYNSARSISHFTFVPTDKNIVQRLKPVNKQIISANSKAFYSTKQMKMDEKLEFDYVVTYPNNEAQINPKQRIQKLDNKVPVVILFGWAHCKDKHLAKYSKIYEDKGMITIRYCLPNQYFFWEPSKMPIIGQKIANLSCELNLDEHPIFVQSFSNGGSTVYLNMSKALDKLPRPLNIKGILFDSTPGSRRLIGFYRVLSEVYREQKLSFVAPRAFFIVAGVAVLWNFEKIYNLVNPKGTDGYLDVCRYLNTEKYRWPQHCIYSTNDNIVYAPDIARFIECRKKLGIDVTSLCFNDSPHVSHYMYHKEEYTKSVLDFIDKCLNKDFKSTGDTTEYPAIKSKL